MLLELENNIRVTVKVLQGKYKGQSIPLATSLSDLLNNGLPDQLIQGNVFESICHPCDYYKVETVEYLS